MSGSSKGAVRRIAALYDIHGNLPALQAVLSDVERNDVDLIVVGGDVVLGPMPRETLASLKVLDIPVQYIRGNCDRNVVEHMSGVLTDRLPEQVRHRIEWVARQLDPGDEQWIACWPKTISVAVDESQPVLFCHATPRDDNEILTVRTPEDRLLSALAGVDEPTVVCGHTHIQFDRRVGRYRAVNAGSVGMPFGEPGAYWLLIGRDLELKRTSYDLSQAAGRVRATDYPGAEEFAERNILNPPTEAEMLELFSGVHTT